MAEQPVSCDFKDEPEGTDSEEHDMFWFRTHLKRPIRDPNLVTLSNLHTLSRANIEHRPIFVFDLDGTLISHPSYTREIYTQFFEFPRKVLNALSSPDHILALASYNHLAMQPLDAFGIRGKFKVAKFPRVQLTTSPPYGKVRMIQQILWDLDLLWAKMEHVIFFDDDHHNVREVNEAGGLAVQVHVATGVTEKELDEGLQRWAVKHGVEKYDHHAFWKNFEEVPDHKADCMVYSHNRAF